jgi:hypothetical protein
VLIPAEETSGNDGVAQSRGRFATWDAPEGPGSSVEGQAAHRLPPGARGPGDAHRAPWQSSPT